MICLGDDATTILSLMINVVYKIEGLIRRFIFFKDSNRKKGKRTEKLDSRNLKPTLFF